MLFGGKGSQGSEFHRRSKDPASTAQFHFGGPGNLGFPPTDRPVHEPTHLACMKLPGRAFPSYSRGAFSNGPAGVHPAGFPDFERPQKEQLTFGVDRNFPPPLLKTLNRPERDSQQLRNFLLGLLQPASEGEEFLGFHRCDPFRGNKFSVGRKFPIVYITWC